MTCETTKKTRSVNSEFFIDENGYQYLNNSKFEFILQRAIRDTITNNVHCMELLQFHSMVPIYQKELKN